MLMMVLLSSGIFIIRSTERISLFSDGVKSPGVPSGGFVLKGSADHE